MCLLIIKKHMQNIILNATKCKKDIHSFTFHSDVLPLELPLTESHIHVTGQEPLLTHTVGQVLEEAYLNSPNHVMAVFPEHDQSVTVAELRGLVSAKFLQ